MPATKMRHQTGIQWTHVPGYIGDRWNPTTGCTRVSPGCEHCYAFALHDQRYVVNRDHARKYAMSPATYRQALKNGGAFPPLPMAPQYDVPFSTVQVLDDKRLTEPLRKRQPHAFFVDSMSDLFHEDVPADFILRVWKVMRESPQHLFLILTKRPRRMQDIVQRISWATPTAEEREAGATGYQPYFGAPGSAPLPNVWLGTSVENNEVAQARCEALIDTPAAVRFLSCEPLLEDISAEVQLALGAAGPRYPRSEIDWVIVGGESGAHSRPFDLGWARALRLECQGAGVAFFMKQMGSKPTVTALDIEAGDPVFELRFKHNHGGNPQEWPEDLRVREFPAGHADWFSQAEAVSA